MANYLFFMGAFLFSLGVYFIPTAVANQREHHNTPAIFWANLFFGWTVLGWCLCFIWAMTSSTTQSAAVARK